MGEHLEDGETAREDCPECGRRKTFTVTRTDDGLLYNCYSAHCELTGGVVGGTRRPSIVTPGEAEPAKRVFKEFDEPLVTLQEKHEELLYDKFNLSYDALHMGRVRYCETQDRFAFPIFAPRGHRRGYVLRSLAPRAQPKALTHMERDEPGLAWYNASRQTAVVVVEDIPSALRLGAAGIKAVSLLGTSCGGDKLMEIAEWASAVIWALDPDATGIAQRLHSRYRFHFSRSCCAVLRHDIKDMTEGTFHEFCNLYL